MAVLSILTHPDSRLRAPSVVVGIPGDADRVLLDDMMETMRAAKGAGLAAPQVGTLRRLVVLAGNSDVGPLKMVDPEIVWRSDEAEPMREGCLSVPGARAEVKRALRVRVRWMDETGESHEIEAGGVLAQAVQHELDHLDGVLYIDRLSGLRRDMLLRKLAKGR